MLEIKKAATLEELENLCIQVGNHFLEENWNGKNNIIPTLINEFDDGIIHCIRIDDEYQTVYRLFAVNYSLNNVFFSRLYDYPNTFFSIEKEDYYLKANELWPNRPNKLSFSRNEFTNNGYERLVLKQVIEIIQKENVYSRQNIRVKIIDEKNESIIQEGFLCIKTSDIEAGHFYLRPDGREMVYTTSTSLNITLYIRPTEIDFWARQYNPDSFNDDYSLTQINWIHGFKQLYTLESEFVTKQDYKLNLLKLESALGHYIRNYELQWLDGECFMIKVWPNWSLTDMGVKTFEK